MRGYDVVTEGGQWPQGPQQGGWGPQGAPQGDRQWAQGPGAGAPPAQGWGQTAPYPQQGPQPTQQYPPQQYPPQQYGPPQGGPGGPPPNWTPPAGYGGEGGGEPPKRRRRWPLIAAVVAIVAVLAGGGYTAWALLGNSGGASSPTEVVTALAGDLEGKDYLRAASRIAPNETVLLTDLGDVMTKELVRLQILKPDAAANQSLDTVTFSGLRFDEAGAETVRPNVTITKLVAGTITTTGDTANLPFTDSFKQKVFPNGQPPAGAPETIDIAEVVRDEGGPIRIATVQVDGEWYVSGLYTAADYALKSENEPWPTTSVPANGAASAQDALKDMVTAALDSDVQRVIELTDPEEAAALHDAGPALVQAAAGAQPSGAKLVDLQTTETDVRGHTGLSLASVTVQTPDGVLIDVKRQGDCLLMSSPQGGGEQRLCTADLAQAGLSEVGNSPALAEFAPRLVTAMLDVKVVASEVDGKWYVSPGQTVVQLYADLLGAMQPGDLDALIAAGGN
ncbi:flagellar basal body protein FliL [Pseudonocardia xishanensis]|uniref:Flagellar basal body-associated protein FliL n=1 Tax=Pseudonocardia xishanensis TaxID=630995 RepID=A0ABP8RH16_9PSEU